MQGITESLPVSSSAHLGLARAWRGEPSGTASKALDTALHAGSLAGAGRQVHRLGIGGGDLAAAGLIAVPAAVLGAVAHGSIARRLGSPRAAVTIGAVAATVMWWIDRSSSDHRCASTSGLTLSDRAVIGAAQAAALVPGVSRSGAVYAAARSRGVARSDSASIAIATGIPVIVGAAGFMALQERASLTADVRTTMSGAVAAAATSYVTSELTPAVLTTGMGAIVVYRWALALAAWLTPRLRRSGSID